MFCGTGNFSREDDDPRDPSASKCSRRKPKSHTSNSKNPYAARGLDKFSTVLAKLEARREKILARTGPESVSMIRFVYNNSDGWVPIIVRLRDQHQEDKPKKAIVKSSQIRQKPDAAAKDSDQQSQLPRQLEPKAGPRVSDKTVKKSFSPNLKEGENGGVGSWLKWRSTYFWPVALVLILFCLVLFGRMFAICCTSIWWYIVPTLKDESGDVRKSMKKKKDYRRRLTDKKVGAVVEGLGSPGHQANGKKR